MTFKAYLVGSRRQQVGERHCTDFTRYRTSQGTSMVAVDAALAAVRVEGPGRMVSYFRLANKVVPTYESCLSRLRLIRVTALLQAGRHAQARDELLSLDSTLFPGGYARLLLHTDSGAAAADLERLLTKAQGLELRELCTDS